jgi:hypothetical protein
VQKLTYSVPVEVSSLSKLNPVFKIDTANQPNVDFCAGSTVSLSVCNLFYNSSAEHVNSSYKTEFAPARYSVF